MTEAAASFLLPPMTRTADIAALEAWLADPTGAPRALVAEGRVAPKSALAWMLAHQWQAAGFVTVIAEPQDGGEWRWFVERQLCRVPAPARRSGSAAEPEAPDGSSASDCILRAIRRAANFGRAAPSLRELARLAGLKHASNASYYVDKLKRRGAISVENKTYPGGSRRRYHVIDTHGTITGSTEWGR